MTFPLLSLTFAVLRCPELGFLGFVTPTFRHTPFIAGRFAALRAGETAWRAFLGRRLVRVRSWLRVMDWDGVELNERVGQDFVREEGDRRGCREMVRRVRARRAERAEREGMGGMLKVSRQGWVGTRVESET